MYVQSNEEEWPEALAYVNEVQGELRQRGYEVDEIDHTSHTITVLPTVEKILDDLRAMCAEDLSYSVGSMSSKVGHSG